VMVQLAPGLGFRRSKAPDSSGSRVVTGPQPLILDRA
jgi:hypothetical protein